MTATPYAEPPPRQTAGRRLSTFFYRHTYVGLFLLLLVPIGWMVIGYGGSLFVLSLTRSDEPPPTSSVNVDDASAATPY